MVERSTIEVVHRTRRLMENVHDRVPRRGYQDFIQKKGISFYNVYIIKDMDEKRRQQ